MNEMNKVSVRFERPSQRCHHRLTAPLNVAVQGLEAPCVVIDWSTAGLRFRTNRPEIFKAEEVIQLALAVPFHDFNVTFDVQACIVRVIDAATGDVAVRFVDLPARAKELLHYFSDKLVRGEIAPVDGTLKHLDLPTTPPRPETPKQPVAINSKYRSIRPWAVGATYLSLGVALAIGLVSTLYQTIFLVPSTQAMLYSPIADLIVPEDGTVSAVYVGEGDRVAAGDPLLTIVSPRLEQLQSEARIREQEALINEKRLTALVETETHTLVPYGDISADQVVAAEARLASAQQQAAALDRQRLRLMSLRNDGVVTAQQLDQVETDLQRAQDAVAETQAGLRIARVAHTAAQSGTYYSANRLESQLPELRAELVAAKGQVNLARVRLLELHKQTERMTLHAPIPGQVRQLSVMLGSAVSGGRHAISLQSDDLPKVYAMVPSDKLARIAIGNTAQVFIPALSREISAAVVTVEPRIWSLSEDVRKLLGEPTDSGLIVLSLAAETQGAGALYSGLPVSVEMANETARQAVRKLSQTAMQIFGIGKTLAAVAPSPANERAIPN